MVIYSSYWLFYITYFFNIFTNFILVKKLKTGTPFPERGLSVPILRITKWEMVWRSYLGWVLWTGTVCPIPASSPPIAIPMEHTV